MGALGRGLSRLIDVFSTIGAIFIVVMMLHITIDVVLRAFGYNLEGTIEYVTNYHMIIVGFLSLGYAEQKNRQISVELFTINLPGWMQRHIDAFAYLCSGLAFTLLTTRTWEMAVRKMQEGASVTMGRGNLITWPAYYVVPIGCGLALLVVIYRLVCYLTGARSALNTDVTGEMDLGEGAPK